MEASCYGADGITEPVRGFSHPSASSCTHSTRGYAAQRPKHVLHVSPRKELGRCKTYTGDDRGTPLSSSNLNMNYNDLQALIRQIRTVDDLLDLQWLLEIHAHVHSLPTLH